MAQDLAQAGGACMLQCTHFFPFFSSAYVKLPPVSPVPASPLACATRRLLLLLLPRQRRSKSFQRQTFQGQQQQQQKLPSVVQQVRRQQRPPTLRQQEFEQLHHLFNVELPEQRSRVLEQQQQQQRVTMLAEERRRREKKTKRSTRGGGVREGKNKEQKELQQQQLWRSIFLRSPEPGGQCDLQGRRGYSSCAGAAAAAAGVCDGGRGGGGRTAARTKKKNRRGSRRTGGGEDKRKKRKQLVEKERVMKNPFKYENKRDGIELVKQGRIFSPEEVKDGHHLAVLLVTLHKFGFAADKGLLFRYAERAHALAPSLYPKAASLILNVLVRQQLLHAPLLQTLSSRLLPRLLRHANSQDLALLLHAFTSFRWVDRKFLAAAAEEIPHKLPFFEPQHLVAVAQSVAKLCSISLSSSSCSGSSSGSGYAVGHGEERGGVAVEARIARGGGASAAASAAEQFALLLDDIAEETIRKLQDFDARATALLAAALGSAAAAIACRRQQLLTRRPSPFLGVHATNALSFSHAENTRVHSDAKSPDAAAAHNSSLNMTSSTDTPLPPAQLVARPEAPSRLAERRADSPVAAAIDASSLCPPPCPSLSPSLPLPFPSSSPTAAVETAAAVSGIRAVSPFIRMSAAADTRGCTRPLFWERLLNHAFSLREEMSAADVIKVAAGAANAHAQQHKEFASLLSSKVLADLEVLPLPLINQLFNACAKWGYYDKRMFAALFSRLAATAAADKAAAGRTSAAIATAKHDTPDVACIAQLLHACGCLRHREPAFLSLLAYRLYLQAAEAVATYARTSSSFSWSSPSFSSSCSPPSRPAAVGGTAYALRAAAAAARPGIPAAVAAFPVAASAPITLPGSAIAAAATSDGQWSSNKQQQRNAEAAYVEIRLQRLRQQQRITPQTLAVTLRALSRLRWGSEEQQLQPQQQPFFSDSQASTNTGSSSHNNKSSREPSKGSGKSGGSCLAVGSDTTEACGSWKKELLPLLSRLVLQQLQNFTPQGLCECTDSLSSLLHGDHRPLQQPQQLLLRQERRQYQQQYQGTVEQQGRQQDYGSVKQAQERVMLQCDEDLLFYRLSEQLSSKWSLLSLQGLFSVIRAFGRRGEKGDVPLLHRCIDRVRHAVQYMDFEECYRAKQALAVPLGLAAREKVSLSPLLPLQPQQQQQHRDQQQQTAEPKQQRAPQGQQQQKQQQKEGQQASKMQRLWETGAKQHAPLASPLTRAAGVDFPTDAAVLSPHLAQSRDAADAPTDGASAAVTAAAARTNVEKQRPSRADWRHRIGSLDAALDRRMRLLFTTSAANLPYLSGTAVLSKKIKASPGARDDGSTADSSAAAVGREAVGAFTSYHTGLRLRDKYVLEALAAAGAAAREEKVAELLFGTTAHNAEHASVPIDAEGEDNLSLQGTPPEEEAAVSVCSVDGIKQHNSQTGETVESGSVAHTLRMPQDGPQQQEQEHPRKKLQREQQQRDGQLLLHGREQQLLCRWQEQQEHDHLQEKQIGTNAVRSGGTAVTVGCQTDRQSAAETAAPRVFGDSLDTLIELHGSNSSRRLTGICRDSKGSKSKEATQPSGNGGSRHVRSWNRSVEYDTEKRSTLQGSGVSETRSSSRCTRGSDVSSTARLFKIDRNKTDKKNTAFLQGQHELQSAADVDQQDTCMLTGARQNSATTGSIERREMRRRQETTENGIAEPMEENSGKDHVEEARMSIGELLRGDFEEMQEAGARNNDLCNSSSGGKSTNGQRTAAVVDCFSTAGEEVDLRSWPHQQLQQQRGIQVQRNWQEHAQQQRDGEAVQHQRAIESHASKTTHVTRGRRRRRLSQQRQENQEQQESMEASFWRTAAAGKDRRVASEEKQNSLSAFSDLSKFSVPARVAEGEQQAPLCAAATAAATAKTEQQQPADNEGDSTAARKKRVAANLKKEHAAAGEASERTLLYEDAYSCCVDGTGLIVRNKQLRARAAAEGGFETGYVDLTNLLGTAAPATVRRQGSSSTDTARSWTGTGSESPSSSSSPTNTNSKPHGSISNLGGEYRGRNNNMLQQSTAAAVVRNVSLFSAATGGRKSKRCTKK